MGSRYGRVNLYNRTLIKKKVLICKEVKYKGLS